VRPEKYCEVCSPAFFLIPRPLWGERLGEGGPAGRPMSGAARKHLERAFPGPRAPTPSATGPVAGRPAPRQGGLALPTHSDDCNGLALGCVPRANRPPRHHVELTAKARGADFGWVEEQRGKGTKDARDWRGGLPRFFSCLLMSSSGWPGQIGCPGRFSDKKLNFASVN
jgi:hypothetical protein